MAYEIRSRLPFLTVPPPWKDITIVDPRHTIKHVGKEHKARWKSAARKHLHAVNELDPVHNILLYTNATQIEAEQLSHGKWHKLVPGDVSVLDAGLQVILLGLEKGTSSLSSPETNPQKMWVYINSKSALTTSSRCNARNRTFKKTKTIAELQAQKGLQINLSWIPGHQNIPGNNAVSQAAWKHIKNYPDFEDVDLSDCQLQGKVLNQDKEEALSKIRRKPAHKSLVSEEDDPIPPG